MHVLLLVIVRHQIKQFPSDGPWQEKHAIPSRQMHLRASCHCYRALQCISQQAVNDMLEPVLDTWSILITRPTTCSVIEFAEYACAQRQHVIASL